VILLDLHMPGVDGFEVARRVREMHAIKPPLIHQDLKPANILIDVLGSYKITDFSLASATAKRISYSG